MFGPQVFHRIAFAKVCLVFLSLYIDIPGGYCAPAKGGGNLHQNTLKLLLGEWAMYSEIGKFLTDGREKLETDCTTIIWDYGFSTVLDFVNVCGNDDDVVQGCLPVFTVALTSENITEEMTRTLREGYIRQCGGYIIVLESPSAVVDLLHYGDEYRLINTRARFLIWYSGVDKTFEADDIWRKVPNTILFHTKLAYRASKRMTFTIKGFKWPLLQNTADTTRVVDFWSQGKYFGRSLDGWYKDKTTDLRNVTLRIVAFEHPPGVIKYVSLNGQVEYAGNEVEIVKELSSIMNFDYEFVDMKLETRESFEITNSTPSFYGALGRLVDGEADLGIGSFFVLKHYLDHLDMSIPLDVACTSFLTPNPLPRPRFLALILPFNYKLWLLVLSICFVFAPVGLYALAQLRVHRGEARVFTGRSEVVFTSFSIMSQVALHIWPRCWSIRMFIGWFWMFCLLITLAYRGAMVSFLTIPLFERPIDNINDLAASGLRVGGWGSELQTLFKQYGETNGEVATKRLLSSRYELVNDVNTGVSMVADGKFALYENNRFLKFTRQTRNLTRFGSPSMRTMKQCIVPVHIGIAYQKNSPIVPTINRHIRRFQESGLMKRWSQRLVSKTKQHLRKMMEAMGDHGGHGQSSDDDNHEDEDKDEGDAESASGSASHQQRKQRVLNIRDLQGSIYLIIFGFVISVAAFIIELLVANSSGEAENKEFLEKIKGDTSKVKDIVFSKGAPILTVVRGSRKGVSTTSKISVTSKQQFLANMLMEYEGFVRRTESRQEPPPLPRKRFGLTLRKSKPDSVRVKTNDNREMYFTFMQ